MLPLASNVAFCKLATRIQDALAACPLLKFDDLTSLDAELVRWRDDLPPILRPFSIQKESIPTSRRYSSSSRPRPVQRTGSLSTDANRPFSFDNYRSPDGTQPNNICPDILKTPRAIMHWRYQNLRLLLHRPYLLATALRRTPYASLSIEEKVAVGRCRTIAAQTISDISRTCEEELIAGWNAVWLLYQAVMIPLVSLFAALSSSGSPVQFTNPAQPGSNPETGTMDSLSELEEEVQNWRHQIETALQFFDRFTRWSVAAKRSKDVVARLYEASKQLGEANAANRAPAQAFHQQQPSQAGPAGLLSPSNNMQGAQGLDFAENLQSFMPDIGTGLPVQSTWGLSPNGDAAMTNFWFDDMMWDFPAAGTDMPENSGTGFGGCEFDWFSTQDGDFQTWDSNGFSQGPGQG